MRSIRVLTVCLAGISAAACQTAVQPSYPAGQQITLTQQQVRLVEQGVRSDLLDPYSAQVSAIQAAQDGSGRITACGTVNAKNAFGGYVGRRWFIGTILGDTFTVGQVAKNDRETARVFTECESRGIGNWSRPISS